MLREAGKKDEKKPVTFLEQYSSHMPRTMLRYSIERLSIEEKRYFLSKEMNVEPFYRAL